MKNDETKLDKQENNREFETSKENLEENPNKENSEDKSFGGAEGKNEKYDDIYSGSRQDEKKEDEIFSDLRKNLDEKKMDDIFSENSDKEKENLEIYKPKKNKVLFYFIWLVFLTLISVLLAGYSIIAVNDMLGLGQGDEIIVVDIPEGANVDTVAKILKSSGVIKQEFFFKIYAIVTKNAKKFQAGTYELKPNMDYQVLINNIKSSALQKDVVELAFLEGMNIQEYAQLLEEKEVCSKEKFLEKCKSDEFDEKYEFLKEIENKSERCYKLEGYLFPDTYEFYKNEDPGSVIRRFLSNFQKKIIKLNIHEGYDKKVSIKQICSEFGKTLDEILNISSMIQAEAADRSDMYKVSSVIYNRLETISSDGYNKFGEFGLSKLGIDSTVWYPYKTKSAVPSNIVNTFQSSYDTYEIVGLPPGPICNPGLEAIYAALNPENTEYYYFCHGSSQESYYAKTSNEHMINLKKAGLV